MVGVARRRRRSCGRTTRPAGGWRRSTRGPDGVARTREGLVCSLRAEPYEARRRPASRAHARRAEGRAAAAAPRPAARRWSRSSCSTTDGSSGRTERACSTWSWRACAAGSGASRASHAEALRRRAAADRRRSPPLRDDARVPRRGRDASESAWLLAAIVPTEQEGLTIFPTHRHRGRASSRSTPSGPSTASSPRDRSAAVIYRASGTTIVIGRAWRARHRARRPARARRSHVHAVRGRGEGRRRRRRGGGRAFSSARRAIELVRELAERGETMPQKSTYFYPKLPSGLLFHPL